MCFYLYNGNQFLECMFEQRPIIIYFKINDSSNIVSDFLNLPIQATIVKRSYIKWRFCSRLLANAKYLCKVSICKYLWSHLLNKSLMENFIFCAVKSTIRPCMEYCCHVWAGAPGCYLELLDKLQKRIWRTVGPSLAASLEPLAHCQNVASLSLFYRYYFDRCSAELAQLVPLPFFVGGLLVILIDCIIFLSPFLDITRMSMSTVSFLAQLDSEILCL